VLPVRASARRQERPDHIRPTNTLSAADVSWGEDGMTDQAREAPLLNEVRGLAPGFVVSFVKPHQVMDTVNAANHTRFPHVNHPGLGVAGPELLAFACELSAAGDRTIDQIVRTTGTQSGRGRLRRFAAALAEAGYLVPDPPPPRWTEDPVVDGADDASPVSNAQLYGVPEGSNFVIDGGRFVWCDHPGTLRLRLTMTEMLVARGFGTAQTPDQAWSVLSDEELLLDMTRAQFDKLVVRLRASGLFRIVDPRDRERSSFDPTVENAREQVLDETLEAVATLEHGAATRPGPRARVVPVNDDHNMAPLALGLLVAYAQELDGGRLKDRYDFLPMFLTDDRVLLKWTSEPGIFLFSNYIWNYERNWKLSALVKEANPESVTIHGGPSTPKYAGDCEEFFGTNPHVDITVRGEGEATFAAILDALNPTYLTDFSNLHDVAGISFRDSSGIVHTPDRSRIEDLDTIPSPYLLGLFEPFGQARLAAVVESNRGCPYGCTFCDWGSATLSRIRKFDMDRVKAELEWFSRNQLLFVSLCDANFGILERDVEIAEHIAELKLKYGFPKTAALNYAKNTMKHLRPIIDTFASVGLNIEPTVAVQSMDETTLKIVRRSNIKTEKYDELADEFRRSGLRLATDVMMGLPGSTVDSFKSDLQKCTDRDVRARCNQTVLLPNSPMNEPSYREEHGIVARSHEVLKETKTYTREDYEVMERLRQAYYVFDNFAVLRHVARFVRSETAVKEVDFYDRISRDAIDDPLRWPIIAAEVRMMDVNLAPPSSWGLFVDEVGDYLVHVLGVEAGTALDTALQVQLAHLPAPSRAMPQTVHIDHDYVAWYNTLLETRSGEHRDDWEHHAPRLVTFPPGEIKISDPKDICGTLVGKPRSVVAWSILGWDMSSPVARAT
jgi:radical SAM superfamily enzyme YgiQ (UPF0313 family)